MEYKNPAVTIDSIVLRFNHNQLEVLTMKRDAKPFKDYLSLIGGFAKYGETVEKTLERILKDKANLIFKEPEQTIILPIVSDSQNDVRGWIFTVPVLVLVKDFEIVNSNDLTFCKVQLDENNKLVFDEKLAFDHNHILELALNYLRNQLLLHNYQVLKPLLSDTFTSRDLYNIVHQLTGINKTLSNFMRDSALKKAIISTGERVKPASGGPAGQPSLLYKWR